MRARARMPGRLAENRRAESIDDFRRGGPPELPAGYRERLHPLAYNRLAASLSEGTMRPGLRSAAMLLAVAGACAGHAAAAEAERLRLGEMSLGEIVTIPRPTWQGRPLRIETEEFVGMTLLKSEPLVLSDGVHAPYDGYTVVQDLGGVRDVQDAKAHFRLLYRIDIDKAEQEAGRKLEDRAVPRGKVLVGATGRL